MTSREAPLARAYDRVAARPAWAACIAVVAASAASALAGVSPSPAVRYAPLAVSVVLLGLPHGAVDHLVPARAGATTRRRSVLAVGLVYLFLGGAYAALWLVAPVPAALSFVALTWLHWGQGDVHALTAFVGAPHLRDRWRRVVTLLVRGGPPMVVPLLAFPDRYRAVVAAWVGLFGRSLEVAWLFAPTTRAALGVGLAAATLATLAAGYRVAGPTRGWRVDAGETALLWLLFLTVPPLVAVGTYFCVWHSLRHVLRVAAVDRPASAAGALRGFARDAAPLTALALVLLGGFGLLVPAEPSTLSELGALYLVFVAVVTLPHVAVVTWLDDREGVWA